MLRMRKTSRNDVLPEPVKAKDLIESNQNRRNKSCGRSKDSPSEKKRVEHQ